MRVIQSLTQILDLLHTSQLLMGLTCSDIEEEIFFFSSFIRRDSEMPQ